MQLARSVGARAIAVDVSAERLMALVRFADAVVAVRGLSSGRAVREAVRAVTGEGLERRDGAGLRDERDGGGAGGSVRDDRAGREPVRRRVHPGQGEVRLSNLMALDAEVHGNWGCDPALYAGVVERVLSGQVAVRPFVERRPLGRRTRSFPTYERTP